VQSTRRREPPASARVEAANHDVAETGAPREAPFRGRLLVVHEQALIATGLRFALEGCGWIVDTTCAEPQADALQRAGAFGADCVLLDIDRGVGIGGGIELIVPLVATGAKVVMLTAERRRAILAECLEAGATGWIPKSLTLNEVDATLIAVLNDEALIGRTERAELLERLRDERSRMKQAQSRFDQLTPREALVLCALAEGYTAEEIAQQHFVALTTVRSQIRAILRKLDVRSQLPAIAAANAHWWLLPEDARPERERRGAAAGDRPARKRVVRSA
jgi:DNA-binding NarL/FixJ family response regulator